MILELSGARAPLIPEWTEITSERTEFTTYQHEKHIEQTEKRSERTVLGICTYTNFIST